MTLAPRTLPQNGKAPGITRAPRNLPGSCACLPLPSPRPAELMAATSASVSAPIQQWSLLMCSPIRMFSTLGSRRKCWGPHQTLLPLRPKARTKLSRPTTLAQISDLPTAVAPGLAHQKTFPSQAPRLPTHLHPRQRPLAPLKGGIGKGPLPAAPRLHEAPSQALTRTVR